MEEIENQADFDPLFLPHYGKVNFLTMVQTLTLH